MKLALQIYLQVIIYLESSLIQSQNFKTCMCNLSKEAY